MWGAGRLLDGDAPVDPAAQATGEYCRQGEAPLGYPLREMPIIFGEGKSQTKDRSSDDVDPNRAPSEKKSDQCQAERDREYGQENDGEAEIDEDRKGRES